MKTPIKLLREKLRAERALRKSYGTQLDEVGRMLVRAGVLTTKEIRRQGVRFAVRDRFEPRTAKASK